MKKENKKLAQQKRAKERKKQKVMKILVPVCQISIPVILFAALVCFILFKPAKENSNSTDTGTSTEANSATNTTQEENKLLTDTKLEVKDGDTVNIDYVGSIDGVEFAGGNTNGAGTELTIGSGMYIDDFEEQLIGAHPGDEVEVNVTFPENYGNEELNGKEALFKVVINGIYE